MPPLSVKERILEQVGDDGAAMISNVWSQIEYTAYWCIRMLREGEEIVAVIPEAGDDVIVERQTVRELRQVKTREESRGPWPAGEVLDVLCGQYHRRHAHPEPHRYCFVSDGAASPTGVLSARTYGALHRLKTLLDDLRERPPLPTADAAELDGYIQRLAPEIARRLRSEGERCDHSTAASLLCNSVIETNTTWLRAPEDKNLIELDEALYERLPGIPPLPVEELRSMYERLLLLIINRIRAGRSISERRIESAAVLECRTDPQPAAAGLDVRRLPGRTMLEKKLLLGGFDTSELPALGRQKVLSQARLREWQALGRAHMLAGLADALVDRQLTERRRLAAEPLSPLAPGPVLLERMRPHVRAEARAFLGETMPGVEQLGLGLLWLRTSECYARWDVIGLRAAPAEPHSTAADDAAALSVSQRPLSESEVP